MFTTASNLEEGLEDNQDDENAQYKPEALNARAVQVVHRVSNKLTGTLQLFSGNRITVGVGGFHDPMEREYDMLLFQDCTRKSCLLRYILSILDLLSVRSISNYLCQTYIVLCVTNDVYIGRDFKSNQVLDVPSQVDKLIQQATSLENLCLCFIGWCAFW
jgi:hypothetical protein